MPHFLGTRTHKPICPISPDASTTPDKQANKKLLKQRTLLQEKAKQPHVHYEKAARANRKESEAKMAEMSDGAKEAALKAARSIGA